jgi:flagellar hook protein FlgE
MYTGVSGMAANSQAPGIISHNLANANTVGYKETGAQFATLVAQPATQTRYTTGGVQSMPRAMVDQQGLLQSAASPTDLGISGNGFFVVNTQSDPAAGGGVFDPSALRAGEVRAFADHAGAQLAAVDAHAVIGTVAGVQVAFVRGFDIGADAAEPEQVDFSRQQGPDQVGGGGLLGVEADERPDFRG